jgi:hypothetical protein
MDAIRKEVKGNLSEHTEGVYLRLILRKMLFTAGLSALSDTCCKRADPRAK